jgi:hypothetical protein
VIILSIAGWEVFYKFAADFDNLFPILLITGLIEVVSVILVKFNEESFDKFNDFDGITGKLLILVRSCFLVVIFSKLSVVLEKIKIFEKCWQEKLQNYYFSLGVLGISYSSSTSLVIFAAQFIDYFYQHKFIICCDVLIQTFCLIFSYKLFRIKETLINDLDSGTTLKKVYSSLPTKK